MFEQKIKETGKERDKDLVWNPIYRHACNLLMCWYMFIIYNVFLYKLLIYVCYIDIQADMPVCNICLEQEEK